MSEQDTSVAQAYAITEHFSERARRTAAAQQYEQKNPRYPDLDKYARPRCMYHGTTRSCAMGVMCEVDGLGIGWIGDPTPDDIAWALLKRQGREMPEAGYVTSTDAIYPEWAALRDLAARFTADFDRGLMVGDELAKALCVVPSSADEQTNG